jgi:hypothetical protein
MCGKCTQLQEECDRLEKSQAADAKLLSQAIHKSDVNECSLLSGQMSRNLSALKSAHRRYENHRLTHRKEEVSDDSRNLQPSGDSNVNVRESPK